MLSKSLIFKVLFCISFLIPSALSAASISDIEIIVKETVIKDHGVHPYTGEILNFGHIGDLRFVLNDEPHKCVAKVTGVIFEQDTLSSQEVMSFLVCVKKDLDGSLWGETLWMTYTTYR